MMKKVILLSTLVFLPILLAAQVPEFDQLEMRYNQMHYDKVNKTAKKLLEDPSYDYSYLPGYYLALSQLQLIQDKKWRKKNKHAIEDASKRLLAMRSTVDGKRTLEAHKYEMSALKKDLIHWMYQLKRDKDEELFIKIKSLINTLFGNVPDVEQLNDDHIRVPVETSPSDTKRDEEKGDEEEAKGQENDLASERHDVMKFAKQLLGVPYKWSGETPKGFDCSGFTSYVMENAIHLNLSRTAANQYKNAKKIKRKNVKPGDLVFFSNGSGVSHVGIVYSTNFNSIQMIHASTSVGVSIVDIYQSSYWKKRIKGFGRYIGK